VTTRLEGSTVLVTGGHGFLGLFVLERLEAARVKRIVAPTREALDLRDPAAVVEEFCRERPDVVIHLAARVGGIGANQRHPGTFWRDNTWMGVNVLEGARVAGAGRVVVVGTVCAYPKFTSVPFREDDLWSGFPEETNAGYGVAKRALHTGLVSYRSEFGLGGAYLLPANMYGPGDDFDLESSHVIPAMIRKFEEGRLAGAPSVGLWGTGRPSREFLYVEDCAEAIVLAADVVDDPTPMNLGTGRETTMADLATLVARAVGYSGSVAWDPARPDGQPRRALDTSRARRVLGWHARTSLEQGLADTVAWYRAHPAC
jgi:GDP-L-fucose synthase